MQVFGVSASLSEHEAHWRTFFKSLKERGLNGVKLVISVDHEDMGAARRAVFGSVPWQRSDRTVIAKRKHYFLIRLIKP